MSSSSIPRYKIDNTTIDKYLIQSLISNSLNFYRNTTISQLFHLIDKLNHYNQYPHDHSTKIDIKNILELKLTNKPSEMQWETNINSFKINMDKIYPLNKPGNFGRVLQRKCRLVSKGVMQYQQNKQAKLKQLKSFINKVQHVQNKQLADLSWISTQPQTFKFRIILLDNNQNKKGIYFETLQEAEYVRAYLITRYKKTQVNSQVFGALKYSLLEAYSQGLVNQIKRRKQIKKLKQQQRILKEHQQSSLKLSEINFNNSSSVDKTIDNKYDNPLIMPTTNKNLQDGNSAPTIKIPEQPKKSFMTGFLDDLINRHNDENGNNSKGSQSLIKYPGVNQRTRKTLERLNQLYRNDFFINWKNAVTVNELSEGIENSGVKFNLNDESYVSYEDYKNKKKKEMINSKKQSRVNANDLTTSKIQAKGSNNKDDIYKRLFQPLEREKEKEKEMVKNNELGNKQKQGYLSPINSKRSDKILAHSRKQQTIFAYPSRIQQQQVQQIQANKIKKGVTQKLIFKQIEFLQGLNNNNNINNNNSNNTKRQNSINSENKNDGDGGQKINRIDSIEIKQGNRSQQQGQQQQDNKLGLSSMLMIKPIVVISIYIRRGGNNNNNKDSSTSHLLKFSQSVGGRYQNNGNNNNGANINLSRTNLLGQRQKSHLNKQGQLIFNTIIKGRDRTWQYELSGTQNDGVYEFVQDISNMQIHVSVSNLLTNEEILSTWISFKEYSFSSMSPRYKNTIIDTNSILRLKFHYITTRLPSPNPTTPSTTHSSLFFSFPKINPTIIHNIKTYWQSQAVSNSYYNLQDNFNLFDAVTNSSNQPQPSNWWIDLDLHQYNYLSILHSSSLIVGFKLVKPILYVVKALKSIRFNIENIIQILLSIIINLGHSYYFSKQLNQVNYLHRQVGLSKGIIPFQHRVLLEVLLFDRFLIFQCPTLNQKLLAKNISISHLMLQYTYQLFSRNFTIQVLCQFWNYASQQILKVPLVFFLTTIALCKLLTEKLSKCNRLTQVKQVFQSKQIKVASLLINEIKHLRNKYFFKGEGFIEQIKQAFEQKPFEQVLKTYFRKLSQREQLEKKQKTKYKRDLSIKLQQVVDAEQALQILTKKSTERKYILHIYFYQLPPFDGKMIIISGKNQYESLGQQKNRYFIIGELTSKVILKYSDWKGNTYSAQLTFIQGFNEFKIKIYSERKELSADIHYLAGLLTQTQIDIIKTNKKFSHFMAPNITLELFKDQLLKPLKDAKNSAQDWTSQPWFKDLKNMFSYGNKMFNQVNYFMHILQVSPISPQQKILKLRDYSLSLSKEFFLCQNEIIFKHLLFEFYKMSFMSLKEQDFTCYFNDALENQFQAPKILKCRFYCEGKQFELEKQLIQYHSKKSTNFLYGDLFIDQIVSFCQKNIRGKTTSNASQGQLKVLFSTFGQIQLKVIPIKMGIKSFVIDREIYIDNQSIFHELSQKEPQILMTEILPSFAKISTILDYVNSNRSIDLKQKTKQTQRKVIPESINLLRFAQQKFRNCILLRYNKYPKSLEVPFYSYYCELTIQIQKPKFKNYYMNNVKDSLKSICLAQQNLKCSGNNKQQDREFDKKIGLYGNFRRVIKQTGTKMNAIYLWSQHRDESMLQNSLVNINYGYGISRWQRCSIRKYRRRVKQRVNKKGSNQGESRGKGKGNGKIEYLVQRGDEKWFAREYEVKMGEGVKEGLSLYKEEGEKEYEGVENDIKKGFSFLIDPNNLKDFVKSIKMK